MSPVVQVHRSGDLADLPQPVEVAVYRICQESVTNAIRHSLNAAAVTVEVTGDGGVVRLRVHDDGEAARPGTTTGYGLVGMAERAKLLGGSCQAGRTRPAAGPSRRPCRGRCPSDRRGTIRVVVADDQLLVRTGLTMILNAQPGIEVVGEATDGHEAVAVARDLRPDVCLFDIRMPGIDGVEATRQLAGPGVEDPMAVVVITTFDLDEYVHGALKAGARGFLLKDAGPELLVQAIHAAANGDALISPDITRRLLTTLAGLERAAPPPQPIEPLTEREEEVLLTVARGRTNAEIADELHISLSTVKTHIGALMNKLGARNRVEVAMWAYETGRVRG